MRFVVSLRLGEPPSIDPIRRRLDAHPQLRFKLDPTSSWDERLIAELVATGAVDSVDFKGLYSGSIVDQPADPVLYRRVVEAFPDAWIEDPALTPETDAVLAPHRERFSWDAPIHSIADIESLPYPPRMVNIKPSRLGGAAQPARRLRLLRGARDRQLRRRAVRARRRARPDPVPRLAVPPRRAQRRRARRLQPAAPSRRAAVEPAATGAFADRLPLGLTIAAAGATSVPRLGLPPLDG